MNKKSLFVGLFVFQFFALLSCQHSQVQYNCIVRKMAWDFGSGTIKTKAAEVDTCSKKVLKIVFEKNLPINFKQDIDQSADKKISRETIAAATDFVDSIQKETNYLKIQKHIGVATAAFREAKNADAVVAALNEEFGLDLKIITQDDEARLGVKSALTLIEDLSKPTLIWDIGGGSQQISILENENLKSYKSLWAAVSFKNWMIKTIKKSSASTPNPVSASEFSQAVAQAKNFSKDFQLKSLPTLTQVYGIGGVHSSSLKSRINKPTYTQEDLIELSVQSINKTDNELASKYASTEVTNVALVLGTMQGLSITRVKTLDAGLIEGLLAFDHLF